ncbi:hypothetical protein HYFRA_00007424 [Hymenoscyphus fraxineus]|uniref:Uncharacterized protein n=1 Tax=Hymenoscyphus fraxineus TaxID=746836 RepID=A0A9N9KRS0_9HELO|nr:hypothetical protein HYFRA_00007424 [Hymenoscyphus fraxineus]
MEPWVQNFGFLVYRLSYSETDEEWAAKKERIIQEVEKGWEGVVDAESVGRKAVLRWIDGRKVEIEEGDLEAARKHFNSATIPDSPNHIPRGLTTRTALAVTPASLKSFDSGSKMTTHSNTKKLPGDFCPFIHAIGSQC